MAQSAKRERVPLDKLSLPKARALASELAQITSHAGQGRILLSIATYQI
jgi:hypothetical protein